MRVISGLAKGHRLFAPAGYDTRPTLDSVRESLFNMLAADIGGCAFLDLFAGTGAVGIEALSRGAERSVFVDKSGESIKVIQRNLEKTGLSGKADVFLSDAELAIKKLAQRQMSFDIIFLDPPYGREEDYFYRILCSIEKQSLLNKDGVCIIERQLKEKDLQWENIGFVENKVKTYGNAKMVFLSRGE